MSPPLVVGNWKMHGTQSECVSLARKIVQQLTKERPAAAVVLAPPHTALAKVAGVLKSSDVRLAAQNSHWEQSGAFTGEISPAMLRDAGCEFVILGHSERRQLFGETDERIHKKIEAVIRNQLRPVLCVGETLAERRRNLTGSVISRQLRIALKGLSKADIGNIEVAYEPVWAIGTGQNATPEQITEVHQRIRRFLRGTFGTSRGSSIRILYGGSVKPENAAGVAKTPEVNGLLVGGASLRPETFLPIVRSF